MKKKIIYMSLPVLFFLILLSVNSYAYVIGDEKGEMVKGNIIYARDGKAIKEFVRDERGEILRTFVFTDFDKYGSIKKADIYDYNNLKQGNIEFLYENGKLLRAIQRDTEGNIVKSSYFERVEDEINEFVQGQNTWNYIREYNLKDKNYVRIQDKKNISKIKTVVINGEKYIYETIFNLENRAIIEYVKDGNRKVLLKYVFSDYHKDGKIKKAEIKDYDDSILGAMEFIYFEEGNLKTVNYYDRDGKQIAISDIKNLTGRLIENYIKLETNEKEKISYEIDDKIIIKKN